MCSTRYSLHENVIDLDSAAHVRDDVIELIKKEYGYDKVLPMSTYSTEGNNSTILSVCRGLGIDNVVADNLKGLLRDDQDLHTQFYGNKKKGIKPNQELITAVENFKDVDMKEYLLIINGLVSGRSQHASGVVVFNDGYINEGLAMMKTKSGNEVTCYNADEVEFLGGLKFDILSTDALTRIMKTMELLIEHNEIEWKGNWRDTYNEYLHPNILDYTNQEIYDLLYNGDVISAFQFDSPAGSEALRKVNARSFDDLCNANSLMRLSVRDREQPIDKYVRFRDSPELWIEEMQNEGLLESEIELLRSYLDEKFGIADTQELLMQLSMEVADYNLTEANHFRKLVAAANKKALEEEYEIFIEKGLKKGTRIEMLNYVWSFCFEHSFGYSFSMPHITSYTIITIQEMNLAYRYSPLYWQTACMIVDSGAISEDSKTSTDYGAIARAINQMPNKVSPPNINISGMTFTPDPSTNTILFGIQPIRGLTKASISSILKHRPFKSFKHFYETMVDIDDKDKRISEKQTIILIKAGAFNQLENKSSWDIMIDFVNMTIPKRERLTITQFPTIFESIFNKEQQKQYAMEYHIYQFRQFLRKNKFVIKKEQAKDIFLKYYSMIDYKTNNNTILVDKNSFENYYDDMIDPIRQLINTDEMLSAFNSYEKREFWLENCIGNTSSWEVETISFYSQQHELELFDLSHYFEIVDFNTLKGNGVIAGTVIDKDTQKNIVYLSTEYGVVKVKLWKNLFQKYNTIITNGKSGKNRVVYEDSWFDVGNILVCVGYRRGEQFFLSNRFTKYTSSLYRVINYNTKGQVQFTGERKQVN